MLPYPTINSELHLSITEPSLQKDPAMRSLGARISFPLVCLLVAGCGLLSPRSSKRVTIVPFSGQESGEFQSLVEQVVSKTEWELVSPDVYGWTAKKEGADLSKGSDATRISRRFGIRAVVQGRLVRKNKRRSTLKLTVRDAETGKVVDQLALRVRRGKLSEKGTQLLGRRVMGALDDLVAAEEIEMLDTETTAVARKEPAKKPRAEKRLKFVLKKAKAKKVQKVVAKKPKAKKAKKAKKVVAKKPKAKKREKVVAKKPKAKKAKKAQKVIAKKPKLEKPKKIARRGKPAKSDNPDREYGASLALEVDASGQVVDDDMPAALR